MIDVPVAAATTAAVRTVRPEVRVTEAARELSEPGVAALVVLEAGAVAGVVNRRQLMRLFADEGGNPPVGAVARPPETTFSPETSVRDAAERMRADGVDYAPVVEEGTYRGLVTAASLAPFVPRYRLPPEADDWPTGATTGSTGEAEESGAREGPGPAGRGDGVAGAPHVDQPYAE